MGEEAILDLNTRLYKDLNSEYKSLLLLFSELAAKEGVRVVPFLPNQETYFSSLPMYKMVEVMRLLKSYVNVCVTLITEGQPLGNTAALTWQMLKEYNLTPQADIMDKIKSTDVVEFYNKENVQIFRNLNFFKICSYSFDELLCRPWWELYRRDDLVTRQIFESAMTVFTDPLKRTLRLDSAPHLLEEVASTLNYKMDIMVKYMSPLCQNGETVAGLVIEEASLH